MHHAEETNKIALPGFVFDLEHLELREESGARLTPFTSANHTRVGRNFRFAEGRPDSACRKFIASLSGRRQDFPSNGGHRLASVYKTAQPTSGRGSWTPFVETSMSTMI